MNACDLVALDVKLNIEGERRDAMAFKGEGFAGVEIAVKNAQRCHTRRLLLDADVDRLAGNSSRRKHVVHEKGEVGGVKVYG